MAAEMGEEKATPLPRTPRSVINGAIRETAAFNALIYWGLIIFGLTGVMTILIAVYRGDAWIGGIGAVPAALCWPAMRYAFLIRNQIVALRMLELSLNNVKSAEQALEAINKAFGFHFGEGEARTNVVISEPKAKSPRSGSKDY
jgi:hypothetical protein